MMRPVMLTALFIADGAMHLVSVPVILSQYWLLQELYSGFASTNIEVEMLYVPFLLIFGILLLATSLLVWRGRGRLLGALLVLLSIPLNLLVIEVMRLSWISVALSVVNLLLNLLLLVRLFALKRFGVRSQSIK